MKDGGPAFPRQLPEAKVPPDEALEIIKRYSGMSLRDWYAGMALTGLINCLPAAGGAEQAANAARMLPATAYEVADAMLAEREKEEK